jgi:hypothetical protein
MAKPQLKIDDELVVIDDGKDYHFDNIPEELRLRDQWVLWRYEERPDGKKPAKAPYCPEGYRVDLRDPEYWLSYADAISHYDRGGFDGIGFVFTKDDPFVFIDFDKCFADGDLVSQFEWLEEWLPKFYSYTEVSPSSDGLHVIIKVKDKSKYESSYLKKKNSDGIEIYTSGRFSTVTGDLYSRNGNPPTSIKRRDATFNEFIAEFELENQTKIDATKAALVDNPHNRVKHRQVDWFGLDISQSLSVEQLKRYGQYNYKALKTIAGHRLKTKYKANSSGHKYDFPCREGGSPTTHFYDEVNNHFECLADRCDERDFFERLSIDGDLSKAFAELEKKRDEKSSNGTAKTEAALDDDLQSSIESDLIDLTGREFRPPSYLHRFIMERQINLLAAGEGTGKTFATLALVAELSRKRIKAVYFSCEDDEDEIGRRLEILDADFSNIRVICFKSDRYNLSPIGIECILAAAISFGADLIVIDPLSSYAGGRKLNDEASIREALDPLREKLKLHNTSVLVIHHWNKEGKIANSRQITAAARLVTQIFPSRDVSGAMVMVITKSNHSDRQQASSLAYRITADPDDPNKACFDWLPEHPNVTWEDLQTDTRHLEKLMIDYINENQDENGEVLLSDLRDHCAEEPYCYKAEQVRNVYWRKWGVKTRKQGKNNPVYWIRLPVHLRKSKIVKLKKFA